EEQDRLDELTRPKELRTHQPGEPLDLPVRGGTAAGGTAGGTTAGANPAPGGQVPPPPANISVAPSVRSVDRVEK
ncbi:MAG TPA: hypothetical protein VF316_08385, partial [Polyangiaceae bacterium]